MKILLTGATGAIGRQMLPLLQERGLAVVAMTSSDAGAAWLQERSIDHIVCDALDEGKLQRKVSDTKPDVIINQLTAIPKRINPRRINADLSMTNTLRRNGTANLMRAGKAAGVSRFISQSVAFAYRPDGASPAVETEPLYADAPGGFSEVVDAVLSCEDTTLHTNGVRGSVLRYGYFYGPGTAYGRDGAILQDIKRRRFPIVAAGGGVFSFIHTLDAAKATVQAVLKDAEGVFNIVDDEPAAAADWLPFLARLLHAKPPRRVPGFLARIAAGPYGLYAMTRQRGASNAKARDELGWSPQYASWRDGFAAGISHAAT